MEFVTIYKHKCAGKVYPQNLQDFIIRKCNTFIIIELLIVTGN